MQPTSNEDQVKASFISPDLKKESPNQAIVLPAKRNLRSVSNASSTGGESSITTSTSVSSTSSQNSSDPNTAHFFPTSTKNVKIIKREEDLILPNTTSSTQNEESDVAQEEIAKSRYDLRKRFSPLRSSIERITPVRDSSQPRKSIGSKASIVSEKEPASTVRNAQDKSCSINTCFNKFYTSGYLRFNLKQLFSIVIASVLLLLTLSIINYFNIIGIKNVNLEKINYIFDQVKAFFYKNVCVNSKAYFNKILSFVYKN